MNNNILNTDGEYCLRNINLNSLSNKTVLITGASGIVGTHFLYSLEYAVKSKKIPIKKIYGIVNRQIPNHLENLNSKNYFEFLKGDLTSTTFLESLPNVDLIIHAATYGQPGKFMEKQEVTIKLNTTVTIFLLENCLKDKGKFLFVSTSEVYNGLPTPPYDETQIGTTLTDDSRACYIEAKRCGEAITNIFFKKGVNAASVRLSLAYGPGTRKDDMRVLNNFIQKALSKNEIDLLDQGTALRTYCYVSDAVNMMWNVLINGKSNLYNVGGISSTSIYELAKLIGDITNSKIILPNKNNSSVSGAPKNVSLDISKYQNEFGNKEFININEGITNTINWQKLNLT